MRTQIFKLLVNCAIAANFARNSLNKGLLKAFFSLVLLPLFFLNQARAAGFEDNNPLKDDTDDVPSELQNSGSRASRPEELDEELLSDSVQRERDDLGSSFFFPAFFAGVAQNDMPVAPPALGNTSLWAYDFRLKFGYEVFESSRSRVEIFVTGLLSYPIRIRDEVGRPLLEIGAEGGAVLRFLPYSASFGRLNFDGELTSMLAIAAGQVQHARHLLNTVDPVLGVGASFASEQLPMISSMIKRPLYLDLLASASLPGSAYQVKESKPLDRTDLAFEEIATSAWNTKGSGGFYEFGAQISTQVSASRSWQALGEHNDQNITTSRLGLICVSRQRLYKSFRIEDGTQSDSRRTSLSLGFVWERKLHP